MKLLTGKQIKRKRLEHNMTQAELGEVIGKKSSLISFIEGGYRPDDLTDIEILTKRLNQPVSAEAKAAVEEKKARAKARKMRDRRKAQKAA